MKLIFVILVLFFGTFSSVTGALPQPPNEPDITTSNALRKFSCEYAKMNHVIPIRHISPYFDFYSRMVLFHIRCENYAQSFLDNKVDIAHVIGLALAFNPYRSHPISGTTGFRPHNEVFLGQVYELYKAYRTNQSLRESLANQKTTDLFWKIKLSGIQEESSQLTEKLLTTQMDLSRSEKALSQTQATLSKTQQDLSNTLVMLAKAKQALFQLQLEETIRKRGDPTASVSSDTSSVHE